MAVVREVRNDSANGRKYGPYNKTVQGQEGSGVLCTDGEAEETVNVKNE